VAHMAPLIATLPRLLMLNLHAAQQHAALSAAAAQHLAESLRGAHAIKFLQMYDHALPPAAGKVLCAALSSLPELGMLTVADSPGLCLDSAMRAVRQPPHLSTIAFINQPPNCSELRLLQHALRMPALEHLHFGDVTLAAAEFAPRAIAAAHAAALRADEAARGAPPSPGRADAILRTLSLQCASP
jgi:hypothetical protein